MKKKSLRSGARIVLAAGLVVTGASGFSSRAPLVVVCAGDSIMRPMPAHFRTLAPEEGLDLEIHEWAQGGLTSETYLSFLLQNLPDWAETKGDAILLQLGTNDAAWLLDERRSPEEFWERIVAILRIFKRFQNRAGQPPLLFLATVPYFCDAPESAGKNRIVDTIINPILMRIAAAEGAILVDTYAVLKNRPEYYDPDCIHPNTDGEIAIARNWLRALRAALFL